MRKRGVYLMMAVLVVGGVLVTVFGRREREPEYGGKRLSEWVMKLPSEGAEKAIRAIGTNALPYLMKWIRYDMPSWKQRLYGGVNAALSSLNSEWGLSDEQTFRSDRAVDAFRVLGGQAKPAIPELSGMLNDPKGIENGPGAVVLGVLGSDGLPPLLAVVTNQQQAPALRSSIVYMMAVMGTNLETCDQVFNGLLTDTSLDVREAATNALGEMQRRALRERKRAKMK
jgi:hypothetical protein